MNSPMILTMMISVSLIIGAIALFGVLWGLKNGQFDDRNKFLDVVHFDGEDDLNDAINLEKKQKKMRIKKKDEQQKSLKKEI